MKKINFPHDPFSTINKKIIKPEDFWKSFKKQYSEDYVGLNFINLGFEVFKPFQDVGTDRILIKHLCESCNFINEDSAHYPTCWKNFSGPVIVSFKFVQKSVLFM